MDPLPKRERRALQELQRVGKGAGVGDLRLADLDVTAERARELVAESPYVELCDDGVVRQNAAGKARQESIYRNIQSRNEERRPSMFL